MFVQDIRDAQRLYRAEALQALEILKTMCGGTLPPRVPGMDTVTRLAWRIRCGRTPAEAASREYVYRWKLALQSPICFGAPHAMGL